MKLSSILTGSLSLLTIAAVTILTVEELKAQEQAAIERNAVIEAEIADLQYQEQLQCMALNIYHEARSDSTLGQEAVGMVTMNRVYSEKYPDTICDVVYQSHLNSRGNPIRNKCQFSWYCDGKNDTPHDKVKFKEAMYNAEWVMKNYGIERDITDGATMYHASYVNPYWSKAYSKTSRIESHIFYK
jgi:spore germination cell wall hydrolase CwlJ-like protein